MEIKKENNNKINSLAKEINNKINMPSFLKIIHGLKYLKIYNI